MRKIFHYENYNQSLHFIPLSKPFHLANITFPTTTVKVDHQYDPTSFIKFYAKVYGQQDELW